MNDNEYIYEAMHEWIDADPEHRRSILLSDLDTSTLSKILQRAAELKKNIQQDLQYSGAMLRSSRRK